MMGTQNIPKLLPRIFALLRTMMMSKSAAAAPSSIQLFDFRMLIVKFHSSYRFPHKLDRIWYVPRKHHGCWSGSSLLGSLRSSSVAVWVTHPPRICPLCLRLQPFLDFARRPMDRGLCDCRGRLWLPLVARDHPTLPERDGLLCHLAGERRSSHNYKMGGCNIPGGILWALNYKLRLNWVISVAA